MKSMAMELTELISVIASLASAIAAAFVAIQSYKVAHKYDDLIQMD